MPPPVIEETHERIVNNLSPPLRLSPSVDPGPCSLTPTPGWLVNLFDAMQRLGLSASQHTRMPSLHMPAYMLAYSIKASSAPQSTDT